MEEQFWTPAVEHGDKTVDFIERISNGIEENKLISRNDHIIAGVSGGADSVCLLCALVKLRDSLFLSTPFFEISVLHVNHGIRGAEADRDEMFVARLCERLGVEFRAVHADVPAFAKKEHLSTEEAGRLVRHEAFERRVMELKQAACDINVRVALAHHMDDQAETVLHNMMRGSALKGLAGMSPESTMQGGYTIIRPLLKVRRCEIEEWLSKQGQDFCTDSTNTDGEYTRNRLRNTIIPMLTNDVNDNAVQNIAQTAEFMREAEEYIRKQAKAVFGKCRVKKDIPDELNQKKIYLDVSELKKCENIIQKYVIYDALVQTAGAAKDICAVHVSDIAALLDKKVGSSVSLPYSVVAKREYDTICIKSGDEKIPSLMWYGKSGWYSASKELGIRKGEKTTDFQENDYTKCIDCDKIKFNLQLRTRREGDYICVYKDGRTKKLKNFFIEQKIPAEYRDRVLLVADGSEIVWVVGFRLSEAYKINELTSNAVCISVDAKE